MAPRDCRPVRRLSLFFLPSSAVEIRSQYEVLVEVEVVPKLAITQYRAHMELTEAVHCDRGCYR